MNNVERGMRELIRFFKQGADPGFREGRGCDRNAGEYAF